MFAGAEVKLPEAYNPKQKLEALAVQFTDEQASLFIKAVGWGRRNHTDKLGTLDIIDALMPGHRTYTTSSYVRRNVPSSILLSRLLHRMPYIEGEFEYWDDLLYTASSIPEDSADV